MAALAGEKQVFHWVLTCIAERVSTLWADQLFLLVLFRLIHSWPCEVHPGQQAWREDLVLSWVDFEDLRHADSYTALICLLYHPLVLQFMKNTFGDQCLLPVKASTSSIYHFQTHTYSVHAYAQIHTYTTILPVCLWADLTLFPHIDTVESIFH